MVDIRVFGQPATTLLGVKAHYDGVHGGGGGVRFQCSSVFKSYTDRSSWRKHRNREGSACAAATARCVAPVLFELLAEDLYLLDSETGLEVATDVDVIAAADVVLPVPDSQCHLSCRH